MINAGHKFLTKNVDLMKVARSKVIADLKKEIDTIDALSSDEMPHYRGERAIADVRSEMLKKLLLSSDLLNLHIQTFQVFVSF